MDTWLKIWENYGLGGVAMVIIALGATYILRRLFAKNDGILTKVGERHIEYLGATERAIGELVESSAQMAQSSMRTDETLAALAEQHLDEDSPFATTRLVRSGVHGCSILEHICKKVDCYDECGDSIKAIKRELLGRT